jgi:hypothetical protein
LPTGNTEFLLPYEAATTKAEFQTKYCCLSLSKYSKDCCMVKEHSHYVFVGVSRKYKDKVNFTMFLLWISSLIVFSYIINNLLTAVFVPPGQ